MRRMSQRIHVDSRGPTSRIAATTKHHGPQSILSLPCASPTGPLLPTQRLGSGLTRTNQMSPHSHPAPDLEASLQHITSPARL